MAWQLAIPAALGLVVVQIIAGLYSEGLAARLLLTLVAVTGFGVAALTGLLFINYKHLISPRVFHIVAISLAIAMAGAAWAGYQSPWGLGSQYDGRSRADHIEYGNMEKRWLLASQEDLLIFGDGKMAYYFDSPSHCRYFSAPPDRYPLANPSRAGVKVYRETLECVLSYQGEFILYNPNWFDLEQFPAISEKIKVEYRSRQQRRSQSPQQASTAAGLPIPRSIARQ